jgi:hypothetical protein
MELAVVRTDFTSLSTIGNFMIDNVKAYNSLELPWGDGANIHQKNCILPGTYEVIIDFSPHFQRNMPHILNVPDRDEIRIHIGNNPHDTEGCVLIGLSKGLDFIGNSKAAFDDFFLRLTTALENGRVYINIS